MAWYNKLLERGQACTGWFDGSWKNCCVYHDKLYMTEAGTDLTRAEADDRLFECVKNKSAVMAYIMLAGVRLFGWYYWNKYKEQRNG